MPYLHWCRTGVRLLQVDQYEILHDTFLHCFMELGGLGGIYTVEKKFSKFRTD